MHRAPVPGRRDPAPAPEVCAGLPAALDPSLRGDPDVDEKRAEPHGMKQENEVRALQRCRHRGGEAAHERVRVEEHAPEHNQSPLGPPQRVLRNVSAPLVGADFRHVLYKNLLLPTDESEVPPLPALEGPVRVPSQRLHHLGEQRLLSRRVPQVGVHQLNEGLPFATPRRVFLMHGVVEAVARCEAEGQERAPHRLHLARGEPPPCNPGGGERGRDRADERPPVDHFHEVGVPRLVVPRPQARRKVLRKIEAPVEALQIDEIPKARAGVPSFPPRRHVLFEHFPEYCLVLFESHPAAVGADPLEEHLGAPGHSIDLICMSNVLEADGSEGGSGSQHAIA
mmetsp:Transcript_20782/g.65765  ORF Transcript_20782/g.65765 Transcript_20782/m.65765 type:complete len:339 (-) Transcript_20782:2190-3206(-)